MTIKTRTVWSKQLNTHSPSLSGDQSKETIGCVEITLELSNSTFPINMKRIYSHQVWLYVCMYTLIYLSHPWACYLERQWYGIQDNDTCTYWIHHCHHLHIYKYNCPYVYICVYICIYLFNRPVINRSLFCGKCLMHHTVALCAFSLRHEKPANVNERVWIIK